MIININNLLIIFLVIFLTNIVQTITGFAGSMLAMPVLLLIMPMADAKILIVLVGVFWSLWMLFQNFQKVNWKFVWIFSLVMTIGIIIGELLLNIIPMKIVVFIMGAVIAFSAVSNLLQKKVNSNNLILNLIFGISSGIMQGIILMGGPFLVLVADTYLTDRDEYRTTLAVLWLIVNIVLIITYWLENLFTTNIVLISLANIVPLILAIIIGNLLNKKINNKQFQLSINVLLLFSAFTMLTKVF